MHHLYARFVVKALYDLGHVPFDEPFRRLRLHGTITSGGAKMSKSRGNVVSPDGYIAQYGADITRMSMLFVGPWEEGGDFSDTGVSGLARFVSRAWETLAEEPATFAADEARTGEAERVIGRTVERVTAGVEGMRFHTAIAALMEALAWLRENGGALDAGAWRQFARTFTLLLAPLAPHLAEELWQRLGGAFSIHTQPWPAQHVAPTAQPEIELPVQVDGRVRDRVRVPAGADEQAVIRAALASERVRAALGGAEPRRVVVAPGKMVNVVR
jgi:leucyl-tRNA synthetase